MLPKKERPHEGALLHHPDILRFAANKETRPGELTELNWNFYLD
jgi:hypothetical protein